MSPRVLIVSHREVERSPAYAGWYEFEDVVASLTDATMVAVTSYHGDLKHRLERLTHRALRGRVDPGVLARRARSSARSDTVGDERFDLLLCLAPTPFDLFNVGTFGDLLERADHRLAWVVEAWPNSLERGAIRHEPHDVFTRIFLASGSPDDLGRAWGRDDVRRLPPGVDVLRAPIAVSGPRGILAFNPGRRSADQHQALLAAADLLHRPYLFDTLSGGKATSLHDHRAQYLNLCRHSDLLVANPPRFDEPGVIGRASGVSARPAEGAASGCLIIGARADLVEHGWAEGLVDADIGLSPEPEQVVEVASDRALLERACRTNQIVAAERLDWAHHWQEMLDSVGLDGGPELRRRLDALAHRAESLRNN